MDSTSQSNTEQARKDVLKFVQLIEESSGVGSLAAQMLSCNPPDGIVSIDSGRSVGKTRWAEKLHQLALQSKEIIK